MFPVYIGYDPREFGAFAVASAMAWRRGATTVRGLFLAHLGDWYTRPTSWRDGQLWDDISAAPMSTEFAISRFLVPTIQREGWAIFADCDMMFMSNFEDLAKYIEKEPDKVIWCVKHKQEPVVSRKMGGAPQTSYPRKNWSSFMLMNCSHPVIKAAFSLERVNTVPGRELHRFEGIPDELIGELDPKWNWLVDEPLLHPPSPHVVHYTTGGPWLSEYRDVPYAPFWREVALGVAYELTWDKK